MWRAGLALLFFTAAAADPAVTFPGDVKEVRAPNSEMRITYIDLAAQADQAHDYSLQLEYPGGRSEEIDVFTRSAEVAWSPSGEAFSFTNFIGPNVSDCYVVTPGIPAKKISLTDVVTQGRFPAPAWALQHSAHGAVRCDSWSGPDVVHFVLEGSGGDSPNGFHYAFVYDVKNGIAKLDRAPVPRRKKR